MSELIVKTKNGPVRGQVLRSVENCEYCSFKGIPYAKPPLKELRFKDPEPVDNWTEIRDATKFGDACLQWDPMLRSFVGSEDCLYLNVYTPSIGSSGNLRPVMMFIHGGAYLFGSGNDLHYGPDYLMKKDIILVTINYRLGILGFLNLEDEICTGNQGLKDIVMALKWIHNNIQSFGGDSKNITVFGESSGAFCAHSLALSPLSKSLVHKVICQSGSAANVWARILEPKKFADQICRALGKYTLMPKQILEFFRNMDSERLIKAQEKVRHKSATAQKHQCINLHFGPSLDAKSPNPYMPIPIEELVKQGVDVPMIIGFNSFEGTSFLLDQVNFLPIKESDYIGFDLNFSSIIHPKIKEIVKSYNMSLNDLKRMYFKDEKITEDKWESLSHLQGDLYLYWGIYKSIEIQANCKSNQTYFYKFFYDQSMTIMKSSHKITFSGVTHFEELTYLFHSGLAKQFGFPPLKNDKKGYKIMQQMTEMWANFAKYGNPTPNISELLPVKWTAVDSAVDMPYLKIDEEFSMKTAKHIEEQFKNFKKLNG